jgi:VanZ family protein
MTPSRSACYSAALSTWCLKEGERVAQDAPRRRVFVRYWLPVLAYVVLIFLVSAQPRLKSPMRFQNADKVVHILEYGVLGLLLTRALHTIPRLQGMLLAGVAAVAIGGCVGIGDELFQGFVPGRQSSRLDLVADFIGLSLSQLAYLWMKRP